uniref:Uncharacterized protein n=1 Tax=Arundo donax TaxID=35708 RepID=A0A0A9C2V3_ARUDO
MLISVWIIAAVLFLVGISYMVRNQECYQKTPSNCILTRLCGLPL